MTGQPPGTDPRAGVLADFRFISAMLITFIGIFGSNLVPPALPGIATAFSVSDAEVGLVMIAYTLPSVVMIPAAGILADLYGRRRVVLASVFLFGASGVATAFVDSFAAVLVLRVFQGVGFSGTIPLGITLTGDLYSGARGSTAQGFLQSANGLGNVVAPLIAGAVVALGWYYPFLLFGLAFPVVVFVYRYLPETLPHSEAEGSVLGEIRDYWRSILRELRDVDLGVLYLGAVVEFFAKYAILTFVPLFAVGALGASGFAVGILIAIYGVVKVLVSPLAGVAVSLGSRKLVLLGTMAVIAISIGTIPGAPSVVWLGVLIAVYSAGDAILAPLLDDTVSNWSAAGYRGGIVSANNMFKNVGKTLAPLLLGVVLVAADFTALWLVAAATAVGYGLLAAAALTLPHALGASD